MIIIMFILSKENLKRAQNYLELLRITSNPKEDQKKILIIFILSKVDLKKILRKSKVDLKKILRKSKVDLKKILFYQKIILRGIRITSES